MSLPKWIWLIYYSFFGLTFVYGLIILWKGFVRRSLSILAVILSIAAPLVFLLFSFGRSYEDTEFVFFVKELVSGEIVPWVLLLSMFYIVFWWGVVMKRLIRKSE